VGPSPRRRRQEPRRAGARRARIPRDPGNRAGSGRGLPRVAAAIARGQPTKAAAKALQTPLPQLRGQGRHDRRARRESGLVRSADREGRGVEDGRGARRAEAPISALRGGDAPAPDRRARGGDRPHEVRNGPRGPRCAPNDGVPAADDQRHCAPRREHGAGAGDARRHLRRDHPAHEVRRRWRRSPGPDVRGVRRRGARARCRLGPRTGGRQVRRRRAGGPPERGASDDPRSAPQSISGSRSTSARAIRSRPTVRSPTCEQTAPRCGRASRRRRRRKSRSRSSWAYRSNA
jgi:hypothetical protein